MKFIKAIRKFFINRKLNKLNAELKSHSFSLSLWADLYNHIGTRANRFEWMAETMAKIEKLNERIKLTHNEYLQVDNPCLSYEL